MVDQFGNPAQGKSEVETVFVDVHTWGADPKTSYSFPMPYETRDLNDSVKNFR